VVTGLRRDDGRQDKPVCRFNTYGTPYRRY